MCMHTPAVLCSSFREKEASLVPHWRIEDHRWGFGKCVPEVVISIPIVEQAGTL